MKKLLLLTFLLCTTLMYGQSSGTYNDRQNRSQIIDGSKSFTLRFNTVQTKTTTSRNWGIPSTVTLTSNGNKTGWIIIKMEDGSYNETYYVRDIQHLTMNGADLYTSYSTYKGVPVSITWSYAGVHLTDSNYRLSLGNVE